MSDVEFFFDYSCPWTYLAFTRLRETALRTAARIGWRPILLKDLHSRIDSPVPPDRREPNQRRAKYHAKDLQDWARYCSVIIEFPPVWPVIPEAAARMALAAERDGCMPAYSEGIFRACFEQGRNISEPAVVLEIAVAAGLDRVVAGTTLDDPEAQHRIDANVEELIERGGFGSPTMFVGDDMFFGNDRMPLVEFAIGQASGRTFVMPGQHDG